MKPAIAVQNLSKLYHIGKLLSGPRSLKAALVENLTLPLRRLRQRLRPPSANGNGEVNGEADTIWALKDLSFEVRPGEVIGVLGANGSGKSTLMRVLSRVTTPTAGRVEVRGRVGSLLEVGTGFDSEFTGRENIYLSGPMLGLTRKEIDEKFDQIVAFADVDKFLDTPVKHYSSGMQMRLGFSVAASLDPEILLIDEALSVGDTAFQTKCMARMSELAKSGKTILFVSHDAATIANLCSRAIILSKGRMQMEGPTASVIKEYMASLMVGIAPTAPPSAPDSHSQTNEQRLHVLLDTHIEEPSVAPLANEVASSLINRLPGILVEELVHRLGPSLAGYMSDRLGARPPGHAEAEGRPSEERAEPPPPKEIAGPEATPPDLILHVTLPVEYEAASSQGKPEAFQPKNWGKSVAGYPEYLAQANAQGVDVNDWLDQQLGWGNCGLLTYHTLRPWLSEAARVCELGVGMGRWARHVAPRVPRGDFHLVETHPWTVAFLRKYFQSQQHMHCHLLEGYALPFLDGWFDLIYSFDGFASFPLGKVDMFVREFGRLLRPGGRCVVLYLDTTAPHAWDFLRDYGTQPGRYCEEFAYHAPEALDRVFQSAGLTVERRRHLHEVYPGYPLTALTAVRKQ